ncbi:MAG: dihydroorotate dehydrogenase electron transfer subunit [Acidobacteria bacterium]|nr:dihydroorotate dehydrogenase electron transfer subunit [Acidobacteriota bacterium]
MAHYMRGMVTAVRPVKEYVRLSIKAERIAEEMQPGQFAMISAGTEPLLPRPFSIAHVDRGVLSFIFQDVGRGTGMLASLRVGDSVRLLGPLGKPFRVDVGDRPVMVAGGRGIAPFFELARRLSGRSPLLFYGGRTQAQIIETGFFVRLCSEIIVSTEDGGMGHKGFITEPFAEYLAKSTPPVIYACGPHAMLRRVAEIAGSVPTELSMEARMACGYGICIGCVIPTGREGYRRVCLDGPVFSGDEIRWQDLK